MTSPINNFNNQSIAGTTAIGAAQQIGSGNSSGAPNIGTVDLKKIATIQDLMNTLGLTKVQAEAFLGEHPNITMNEATQLINQQKNIVKQETQINNLSSETEENIGKNYDFTAFTEEKEPVKKAQMLLEAYTQNTHKAEWSKLSDTEKAELEKSVANELLQKYNKSGKDVSLEKIIQGLNDPKSFANVSSEELKQINSRLSSVMADIQTANENNLTYEEYQAQDKDARNYQKFDLISQLDAEQYKSLSKSDKNFYRTEKLAVDTAREFFNDPNLSAKDLSSKISEYNSKITNPEKKISRTSLIYDQLVKEKQAKTISSGEEKFLNKLEKFKSFGANLSNFPDFDSGNTTMVEMEKSEVYQKHIAAGEDRDTAIKYYLNDQLKASKGKALSQEEFDKKVKDLLSGCSPEGAKELMQSLKSMQDSNWIVLKGKNFVVDDRAAIASGDGIDIGQYKESYNKGKITNADTTKIVACNVAMAGNTEKSVELNRTFSPDINLAEQSKTLKEAGVTDKKIFGVYDDVNKNFDKYNSNSAAAIYKAGGNVIPAKYQKEFIDNSTNTIVKNQDENCYTALASSGSTYAKENQVHLAKNVMSMQPSFSDEANIKAQSALADDIQNYARENQLEVHNLVMSSSYSEVQERAANNINNYHESVQSEAFKTVLKSGNQKAIENAVTSYDKMADSAKAAVKEEYTAQAQKLETAYRAEITQEVAAALDKLEDGTTKLSEMSTEQRIKYYTDKFVNGKPSERRAMLQKMLDNGMSKDTFKKLVKYCPELLISMMGDLIQRGLGESILNCLGKSSDLTYKVVNAMMSSGNTSDKKVGAKYVTDNPTQFSKSTRETAEEILHKLTSDENTGNKKSYHATA